ncbi:hypothetical protein P171DRAFT_367811 [Karstenula rhodostoma CBS 690.94]|uniref:Uncharacterized protein n=1 Tax=Karstenula rhodostoma CBS 690.94 TaxID=1392251 RepID=A0A9P4PBR8_9PLEO|nr:hypothetical protein P171DRAFT_367811 [Karstenula rhodostoma CBS 690.94]
MQLRWQCRCKKTFEGNVTELQDNGITELVERMERSIGSKVMVTQAPANPSEAKALYRQLTLQLNDTLSNLMSRFKKQSAGSLPHHNNGLAATTTSAAPRSSSQQRMLHLLACMHANRFRKSLFQDRIESIACDRSLFNFMRDRHPSRGTHLFNDPSCVNENDTWILDQLPRRTVGELHGKAGKPAEGWGIYYQESLNWRLITLIMVVVFGLVSVFGILWAYYKQDIQGAFGVSSYVFAACGIFLSLVAMNSDRD